MRIGVVTLAIALVTGCGSPERRGGGGGDDVAADACAGLDQHPFALGVRSAEMLIAQLQRNERGVPERPTTTTISAEWTDGPTLRKPAPEKPGRA